jgi:hypothetical protein
MVSTRLPPRPVAPDDFHMPPNIPAITELCTPSVWVCWGYELKQGSDEVDEAAETTPDTARKC